VRRWWVFNLVGIGGFVLQLSLVAFLTRKVGWPVLMATTLAVELALVVNFFGHACWTWRDYPIRSLRALARQAVRYQLSKSASVFAGLAVTAMAISFGIPPELANVLAVVVCAGPNFLTDRLVFAGRLR
jgi:putative flippase GtrA